MARNIVCPGCKATISIYADGDEVVATLIQRSITKKKDPDAELMNAIGDEEQESSETTES